MGIRVVTHQIVYPHCHGLEGYGLGLKLNNRTRMPPSRFKKEQLRSVAVPSGFFTTFRYWYCLFLSHFLCIPLDRMTPRNVLLHFSNNRHSGALGTLAILWNSFYDKDTNHMVDIRSGRSTFINTFIPTLPYMVRVRVGQQRSCQRWARTWCCTMFTGNIWVFTNTCIAYVYIYIYICIYIYIHIQTKFMQI